MRYIVFTLTILLFSCKKENSCKKCHEKDYKSATVIWSGPVAADGCDWLIKIDSSHYYHPDTLAADFKYNELNVKICYQEVSDKFYCGFTGSGMPVIHVIDIRK